MDANSIVPGLTSPRFARRRTPDLPSHAHSHAQSQSSLDFYNDPLSASSSSNFITTSTRRMVPRDELELSRPSIARAEKDGDDPSSPVARRRPLPERTITGTPTRLTRLFGSTHDRTSPGPNRAPNQRAPSGANVVTRASRFGTEALPPHLYSRGLLEGKYSDITLNVFGTNYALHRIVLDRAPFFASALSPPWLEASAKEVTLHPEDIDSNITKSAFELALRRLYGHPDLDAEANEAFSLFATGCWLEMYELVSASVNHILRQMTLTTLPSTINVVTVNYYGKAGDRILHAAKALLSRDGAEMPLKYWDDISGEVIRDVVGGDSFYVENEWYRWRLGRRLLNRRLRLVALELGISATALPPPQLRARTPDIDDRKGKSPARPPDEQDSWTALYNHADIVSILDLLENGIYYIHFDFEQLQRVRSSKDAFGVAIVPESVMNDALWTGLEMRQKILNSRERQDELGFSHHGQQSSLSPASNMPSNTTTPLTLQMPPGIQLELPEDDTRQALTPIKPSTQYFNANDSTKRYWIPSIDCNIVTGGIEGPIVTLSTSVSDRASPTMKPRHLPINEQPRPTSFTRYPPFRFSAEFPNPRQFKPGKRVYSQTIFYAGSSWNVYIQKNKNTGSRATELGVYLHRLKEAPSADDDPWSPSSETVNERIGDLERQLHRLENRRLNARRAMESLNNGASGTSNVDGTATQIQDPRLPSIVTDSTGLSTFMTSTNRKASTPSHDGLRTSLYRMNNDDDKESTASSISSDDSSHENMFSNTLRQGKPALPHYHDARPTIKAYFKIYSPSRDGRMLSIYESAPDFFNYSQSWGWTSKSYFTEENEWRLDELELGDDTWHGNRSGAGTDDDAGGDGGGGGQTVEGGRRTMSGALSGGKLRFMIVLGVV